MDTSKLAAARDTLNANVNAVIAKNNADQATIDALAAELTITNNDVVLALGSGTVPVLDFTTLDNAYAAFKARVKTQSTIDALSVTITGTN